MKILYSVLFTLIFFSSNGQVLKLNTLIKGKLIHYSPIVNESSDILGYFYVYDHGKASKDVFDYAYVLLDKNLNLVCSGDFQEVKWTSALFGSPKLGIEVEYLDNKICIKLCESNDEFFKYFLRYRFLDLKTNKLTENYQYRNDSLFYTEEIKRTLSNASVNKELVPAQGIGVFAYTVPERSDYKKLLKNNKSDMKMHMYDLNMNKKWEHKFDREGQLNFYKLYSDSSLLVLNVTNFALKSIKSPFHSIKALDANTGKELYDVTFSGNGQTIKAIDNVKTDGSMLVLYGRYGTKVDGEVLDDDEALGLFKTEINLKTCNIVNEKSISWLDIGQYLGYPMHKNGVNKRSYAKPFVHEFLKLSNNESIVVIENYADGRPIIRDLIIMKLDSNFAPITHEYIEKDNRIGLTASGKTIKRYGQFDYHFSQSLDEQDEILFFFNVNKKGTSYFSKTNEYNILSYLDQKFNYQKIELKTDMSQIYPMPAKKGYMLLLEIFKDESKGSELRLEKVNL